MLSAGEMVLPAEAVAEAKTYLRVVGADEDALIAAAMRSAALLCEHFTGQTLIRRSFTEVLPASPIWTRLGAMPVAAIAGVEALPLAGEPAALPAESYAIDIDANGDGWVRVTAPIDARRVRVTFEAGLSADWTGVPETLRQGVLRLTGHLHAERGAGEARPPAAVVALWRPWRRMKLA